MICAAAFCSSRIGFNNSSSFPEARAASYKSVLSGGPKSSSSNRFLVFFFCEGGVQASFVRAKKAVLALSTQYRAPAHATMRQAVFIDDAAFARAFLVWTTREMSLLAPSMSLLRLAAAIAAGEVGAFSLLDDASMSDAQVFSDLFTRLFMLPSSSSKMFWARTTSASAIINLVRNATIAPAAAASPEASILSSRDRPMATFWAATLAKTSARRAALTSSSKSLAFSASS